MCATKCNAGLVPAFHHLLLNPHPCPASQVRARAAHGVSLCGQRARAAECWTGPPSRCPAWILGACVLPPFLSERALAGTSQTHCRACLKSVCLHSAGSSQELIFACYKHLLVCVLFESLAEGWRRLHRKDTRKQRPRFYRVMLHNDNYNRREYVVQVLLKVIPGMTVDDAVNVMQARCAPQRGFHSPLTQ